MYFYAPEENPQNSGKKLLCLDAVLLYQVMGSHLEREVCRKLKAKLQEMPVTVTAPKYALLVSQ